jgi:hypothetical protein
MAHNMGVGVKMNVESLQRMQLVTWKPDGLEFSILAVSRCLEQQRPGITVTCAWIMYQELGDVFEWMTHLD